MHAVVEIVYGLASKAAVRVRPKPSGVSLVPVAIAGVSAADLARAARQVLSHPRRIAAADTIPKVQIVLESMGTRRWVADDRVRDVRALKIIPPTGAPMATEADTSSFADDIQLQALLAHVAAAFDIDVPDDLGPDLATAGPRARAKDATPKELAILRAHDKLRQQALEIRRLDHEQRRPSTPPAWAIAAGSGGVALLLAAGLFIPPQWRPWAVAVASAAMIAVIGVLGFRAWRRASMVTSLEAARTRASQTREAARRELTELAEKLVRRGADPDEVLGRLSSAPVPPGMPAIVHFESFSSADMQALADLGRPTLAFVDQHGLLFADDYAEFIVRLETPQRPADPATHTA